MAASRTGSLLSLRAARTAGVAATTRRAEQLDQARPWPWDRRPTGVPRWRRPLLGPADSSALLSPSGPRPHRPVPHRAARSPRRHRRAWPARRSRPRGWPANRSCWRPGTATRPPPPSDRRGHAAEAPAARAKASGNSSASAAVTSAPGISRATASPTLKNALSGQRIWARSRSFASPCCKRNSPRRAATFRYLGTSAFATASCKATASAFLPAATSPSAQARLPSAMHFFTGELPHRASFKTRGGLAGADPAQGTGGSRGDRRVTVAQQFLQQAHGLGIFPLADGIDHADQLAAVQFRGGVAEGLVDRRIGDAFQAEAGVKVQFLIGQQGDQGGNGILRAHHGQPLAGLGLFEDRGGRVLQRLDKLGRRAGQDFLGIGLGREGLRRHERRACRQNGHHDTQGISSCVRIRKVLCSCSSAVDIRHSSFSVRDLKSATGRGGRGTACGWPLRRR